MALASRHGPQIRDGQRHCNVFRRVLQFSEGRVGEAWKALLFVTSGNPDRTVNHISTVLSSAHVRVFMNLPYRKDSRAK